MCTREPPHRIALKATPQVELTIDEYLRKRLMPVEGAIPQLVGIDMYGNSIPAGPVGGDLFEYINFQQRYNIDARGACSHALQRVSGDFPHRADPTKLGGCARGMVAVEAGLQ